MVAGMGCSEASRNDGAYLSFDSKAMAECAFPSIFVRSLRHALCIPDEKLSYSNRAAGGTSTKGVLPQLPLLLDDVSSGGHGGAAGPDLLIIDYSANDWADEVIQKSEAGTYKRCNATDAEEGVCSGSMVSHADVRNSTSAAATEILLSYVLASRPNTAVILVESDCHALVSRVAHQRIARHHGVPYLGYVDSLQSNNTMPGPRFMGPGFRVCRKMTRAWESSTSVLHPRRSTHALISTCVEQWWRHFLQNLRARVSESGVAAPPRAPLTFEAKRQELGGICEPRSLYDAKQLLADQVLLEPARTGGSSGPLDTTLGFRVLEGNWSLYEDRPGKPGFITTGPVNSTIDFDVSFGAVPCVSMVYERGYEGFGMVHATLLSNGQMLTTRTPRNLWLTVSGQRDDGVRVTQVDTLFMNHHPLITKWRTEPFTNRTLRLRYVSEPPLKFKFRFLSSC